MDHSQVPKKEVKLGIDNLDKHISIFNNKKVGLITNPTGVNSQLQNTADILKEKVDLILLFGPEHGIRGDAQAGKDVKSNIDKKTGLKVYSLYGTAGGFEPTAQMMNDIDILAYDIQDVGARFYTFISTMVYGMKACSKYNKTFVVFDRPNPLSGNIVEGSMLKPGFQSFVGMLPIPVRYGLTCGELAGYINNELNINCKLNIIPMSGWNRSMFWRDTGLQWIMPSPNIPTPNSAIAYSGTCFFEGTNISEGRGTTQPFEIIGAPWIEPQELANLLNKINLPGVIFSPIYFTPTFSKYQDENCGGVNIHITDESIYQSVGTAVAMIKVIQKLYPDKFKLRPPQKGKWWIDLLTGSSLLRVSNDSYTKINSIWNIESSEFKKKSNAFYLYNQSHMYFDIHTHKRTSNSNTDRIISLFPSDASNLLPSQKYSIGIHPSFIFEKKLRSELNIVNKFASMENIVAIGEIGLDKTADLPLCTQIELFQLQLKISEKLNKPVIIHCVKCFSEILALKKNSTVPWIIHGFRGKPELAAQLVKKNIFLSFGITAINSTPTLYLTIKNTPTHKIFLETDNSEVDIELIYEKVAIIKGISTDMLIKDINNNKKRIFNY